MNLDNLTRLGWDKKDSQELRAKKRVLNYLLLSISFAGIIWGLMYLALGFFVSALFPIIFPVLIAIFLRRYKQNKRFDYAADVLIWCIFLLPLLLQLSIGDFVDSGVVIAWSFCAPLTALLFKSSESAIKWFLVFLITVVVVKLIQIFYPYSIYTPASWITLFFFIMNIGAVLAISFTAILYFSKQLRDSNEKVNNRTKELNSSIKAASYIQRAIIGESEIMKLCEQEKCFAYCQPKDIVCGDFLWVRSVDNKEYYIVADSNEQGVPGALLTIMANNILNNIIITNNILEASKIVKEMIFCFDSFNQRQNSDDKMDDQTKYRMNLGVLILDKSLKKITYAGVNNRIVQVLPEDTDLNSERIVEVLGDEYDANIGKINSHKIEFVEGSIIYLSTDGFENQLGSKGLRTYKHKRFKELLFKVASLELPMQETALAEELASFKQAQPQTDDVLVLGIKV